MFDRILLNDNYFLVTSGLFGGIKVTLKSRGLTIRANRFERKRLLDVLDELKQRGYLLEPHSKEFEEILDGFSEALWGRGDSRWQTYFLHMSCKDIVSDIVGSPKDSQSGWMNQVSQSMEEMSQEEWQMAINDRMSKEMEESEKP